LEIKNEMSQNTVCDIQVLRGISITLILLYHFSISATVFSRISRTMPFYMGVEIFLIMSGYVITNSIMKETFNIKQFFIKRFYRIIPSVMCLILLSCAINYYLLNIPLSDWMRKLFTVNAYSFFRNSVGVLTGTYILMDGTKSYFFGAMWYLSVQIQFYVLIGIVYFILTKFFKNRNIVNKLLLYLSILIFFIIQFTRLELLLKINLKIPHFIYYLANWRFDFLILGVILAFVQLKYKTTNISKNARNSIISLILLVLPLIIGSFMEESYLEINRTPLLAGIGYPICAISYFILIWFASYNKAFCNSKGILYRLMYFVGERSYSIYLFNFFGLVITWIVINKYFSWAFVFSNYSYGIVQILIGVPIILFLAELNYKLIEKPFIKLGKLVVWASKNNRSIFDIKC